MTANKQSFLDETLKVISRCPVCHHKYNKNDAKLVHQKNKDHLVHFTCHHCNSAILAYVIKNQLGITTIALLTDLQYPEMKKFVNLDIIKESDLLDIYKLLEKSPQGLTKSLLDLN